MNRTPRLILLCLLLLISLSACTQDHSRAYNKAVSLFADAQYAEAAEAFDRLGDYAQSAVYAAYSHGLVLYDQGQYSAAEPYFEQVRTFMYGEERYQYCHAHRLMADGQYAEAASVFRSLGEFEDASLQSSYCAARAAEEAMDYESALYGYEAALGLHDAEDRLYNLQGQIYNRAIFLKESAQYSEAIVLFNMLGSYLSSAAQAVECQEYLLDQQYDEADALEAAGDLQSAYELFSALASYRDAADRAQVLADTLGIKITTIDDPF